MEKDKPMDLNIVISIQDKDGKELGKRTVEGYGKPKRLLSNVCASKDLNLPEDEARAVIYEKRDNMSLFRVTSTWKLEFAQTILANTIDEAKKFAEESVYNCDIEHYNVLTPWDVKQSVVELGPVKDLENEISGAWGDLDYKELCEEE